MAVMLLQITAKDKLLEAYIRDIEVSCQGIKPPESTLSLHTSPLQDYVKWIFCVETQPGIVKALRC